MCGIAGTFGSPDAGAVARRMTDAILHRGPDGSGVTPLADASGEAAGALGHARLSIIDLSAAGDQPMVSADGRYTLVYNGEIYNYRALREELLREGAAFRSESDSEVVLVGVARHGSAFLRRLRGMFAFVLWDRETATARLVRDPFGIKPLYLAERGGEVLFASEVRAILASGRVAGRIDRAAVASYLSAGSVEEPRTLVEGVRSIPPGTVVEVRVRDGGASAAAPAPYTRGLWDDPEGPPEADPAVAARRVREALRDSVAHHMVSDVPVAFFLSGGIDSSAVVGIAREVAEGELETFTVVFQEREFDEAPHASAIARRFGTRHHEIPLSGEEMLAALPAAFEAMDQPSMDGLNTYVVSRGVRAHGIKVVLSGLGGDEIFAGYPSFQRARRLAPFWGAGAPLRRVASAAAGLAGGRAEKVRLLLGEADPARAAYRASRAVFAGGTLRALAGTAAGDATVAPPAGLPLLQQVSWYELTGYMRNTLLRDSDVFSMAHGLELRVPFVDRALATVAASVHDRLKLRDGVSKPLLLSAVEDLLPREVWDRPKQGFTLPFERWLRGPLRREVEEALTPRRLGRVGVDAAAAREVWGGFLRGRVGWSRPWALYTLVRWAERNGLSLEGADVPDPRLELEVAAG